MRIQRRIKSDLREISRDFDLHMSACMKAAQAGEQGAYKDLLYASLPLIKKILRQTGASGDELDEMISETLIVIHRVRHTYNPSRLFVTWLMAVSWHVSMDKTRTQKRRPFWSRAKPNAISEGCP